ncbi:unnamed protein product [Darwinula stevensoni]|uniref:Cuticle protein n=1 Tax=Darwinula stevensoni TaxID=69355 RepID=A0A7R8XB38_9CRUS|nr:unnamed protein product [Darwinula stevensoni]CAG0886070.1 unnamed protein product [Darwinula stevensoni]
MWVPFLVLLACANALPVPDGAHHPLPISQPQPNTDNGYPPYTPPANTYQVPQPVYQAPTPTYQAPQPAYQAPTPASVPSPLSSYEATQQGYGAIKPPVPIQIHYDYAFNAVGVAKPKPETPSGYVAPQETYQAPLAGYAPVQTDNVPQDYNVPVQVSFDQTGWIGENAEEQEGEVEGYATVEGLNQESNVTSPPKYHFVYTVDGQSIGDVKGHEESRDGEFTQGKYYVLQPDGKTRTVTYHADDGGFKADVVYV